MEEYFGLTTMLLLVFGTVVFELPLLLAVLAILGIVSARHPVALRTATPSCSFAVAGAVLTPGDLVVGQLAMTASLTILATTLSILESHSWVVGKKRKEREGRRRARAYLEPQK